MTRHPCENVPSKNRVRKVKHLCHVRLVAAYSCSRSVPVALFPRLILSYIPLPPRKNRCSASPNRRHPDTALRSELWASAAPAAAWATGSRRRPVTAAAGPSRRLRPQAARRREGTSSARAPEARGDRRSGGTDGDDTLDGGLAGVHTRPGRVCVRLRLLRPGPGAARNWGASSRRVSLTTGQRTGNITPGATSSPARRPFRAGNVSCSTTSPVGTSRSASL